MKETMHGLGYQKKDRSLLILAVVFLLAAALFFSYQIVVLFGGGEGPVPAPPGNMDTEILNVKSALDGISTELDNIARLI